MVINFLRPYCFDTLILGLVGANSRCIRVTHNYLPFVSPAQAGLQWEMHPGQKLDYVFVRDTLKYINAMPI